MALNSTYYKFWIGIRGWVKSWGDDRYFLRGEGSVTNMFELDIYDDLTPSSSVIEDDHFESDINNDIMPKLV